MLPIPESELIINARGAIYHLDIRPEELAPTVITVGDPARVAQISRHFDRLDVKNQHREFISHTGWIGSKRLTVLSSGIGPDNIDIVLNELDALVNIDFAKRTVKPQLSSLQILRMGTSGSLQADIPVDSFVVSTHGLGIDNLLNFYQPKRTAEEEQILQAFITHTQFQQQLGPSYVCSGSPSLLKLFTQGFHPGITVTCPGFYGPQGRVLRLGLSQPKLVDRLSDFRIGPHRITNFEMETSALYGLGRLLGHHCLSVNVIIANRIQQQYSKDMMRSMDKMITQTLERLASQ